MLHVAGPHVLSISEQLKVVYSMAKRALFKRFKPGVKVDMYLPDFKRGIDHFCIHAGMCMSMHHIVNDEILMDCRMDCAPPSVLCCVLLCAGGRGVIDGIEKNLKLSPVDVEASRDTLYRLVGWLVGGLLVVCVRN